MQTLGQTIADINSLKRSIQLFVATLFIKEDMKKVRSFDDCLAESMSRAGRKKVSENVEMRKQSYLEGRLWTEDHYQALLLQHYSLRDIVSDNKWFNMNGQPDKRAHSTGIKS